MSRAMNFTLTEVVVREACAKRKVAISAIEPLPNGGTHLVCTTIEGADEMREHLAKHLIKQGVRRFAFYRARAPW